MPGGRPTKFNGKKTKRVQEITEALDVKNFLEFATVDCIAFALDVHRDTIYEWQEKHDRFSDAIKRWEAKRNALFMRTIKALPPAQWIFLAKNWLGMGDRQIHEGLENAGGSVTTKVILMPPQADTMEEWVKETFGDEHWTSTIPGNGNGNGGNGGNGHA